MKIEERNSYVVIKYISGEGDGARERCCSKRKIERQVKVLIKNFAYFLSICEQEVSADITKNSAVAIFES